MTITCIGYEQYDGQSITKFTEYSGLRCGGRYSLCHRSGGSADRRSYFRNGIVRLSAETRYVAWVRV